MESVLPRIPGLPAIVGKAASLRTRCKRGFDVDLTRYNAIEGAFSFVY
jgi:hypothetical protein